MEHISETNQAHFSNKTLLLRGKKENLSLWVTYNSPRCDYELLATCMSHGEGAQRCYFICTHRFSMHVCTRVHTLLLSVLKPPAKAWKKDYYWEHLVYGFEQPSFVCAQLSGLYQNSIKNIYINLPTLLNNMSQYPLHGCSLVFREHKGFSHCYSYLKY